MKIKVKKGRREGELILNHVAVNKVERIKVSLDRIQQWYPFSAQYEYVYLKATGAPALQGKLTSQGGVYRGVTQNFTDVVTKDGALFHRGIYERNEHIMEVADGLGFPTLVNGKVVDKGGMGEYYHLISKYIGAVKKLCEERYYKSTEKPIVFANVSAERWENAIYAHLTEEEESFLVELGEIYSMLRLIQKINNAEE